MAIMGVNVQLHLRAGLAPARGLRDRADRRGRGTDGEPLPALSATIGRPRRRTIMEPLAMRTLARPIGLGLAARGDVDEVVTLGSPGA